MRNVEQYYKVLELEPGASPEEIHLAYKDLVCVWHPDRFGNNPRLQKKAHEKLKQINEARDQLRSDRLCSLIPARYPQPSNSNTEEFSNPNVNKTWRGAYEESVRHYRRTTHLNHYDACTWLD